MRLLFFDDFVPGVLRGDEVVSVEAPLRSIQYSSPQDLIEKVITNWSDLHPGLEEHVKSATGVPLGQVRLRPPVPRPSKIVCAFSNYREYGQAEAGEPDLFLKPPDCVIGHGDTVVLPTVQVNIVHHELELGVVMGRTTSKVGREKAMENVFGYVIFLDVSARGPAPNRRPSSFLGKCWDTFGPMGPLLVTADEIPDPHKLQARLWVNGELRQDYNTDDMAYNIPETIEFASSVTTLQPGDVIAMGCNRQGLGPMQQGDVVDMEIEGLGHLTVNVEDPLMREWPRGIDAAFAEWVRTPSNLRTGGMPPPRIEPSPFAR